MKKIISLLLIFISFQSLAQNYNFEPNTNHPFGLPNPEAPKEILDWSDLIGECNCKSITRNQDGSWADTTKMTWRFKYIMNGWAIQDETLKADGKHSGSIRQFIADSSRWFVHYYSSNSPTTALSTWEGNKNKDGNIVLYRDQTAPNGTPGFYRLTFSEINSSGFNWAGEWVNKAETFTYPTWKIFCKKKNPSNNKNQKSVLLAQVKAFSKEVVAGNAKNIAGFYTEDGKLFPNKSDILTGQKVIEKYWTPNENYRIVHHKITPSEIKFLGDYAYDYGYYEGKSKNKKGEISAWGGKYVIVWRKENDIWKIYLDIWNQIER